MAAKSSEKEQKISGHILSESVRVISESVGVNGLGDDATTRVAEDCTYRIKQIVQDAVKFMQHGKRKLLTTSDFDQALRVKNVEPLYGLHTPDLIPFRYASGGGRELHFNEEKEMDLQDVLNSQLPKIPLDVTVKAHWLSIEGLQPSTADNPPPVSKDQQKKEILDTDSKATTEKVSKPKHGETKQKHKFRGAADVVKLKDLTTHELSVEQQLYYKEITEACVGPDEGRRTEALQSLATDPGLHQMLPRFSTFISEGVKINVVQNNLALLIYLMRMVKSIMDNQSLFLEKYLHELIPGVCTCIVSKQLCMRPEMDNHWALRDFAARLVSMMCKNFSGSTNNIQARITKTFCSALKNEKSALATVYGALAGLGELGAEVIKMFVLQHVKSVGDKLKMASDGPVLNSADKIAADNIKKLVSQEQLTMLTIPVAAAATEHIISQPDLIVIEIESESDEPFDFMSYASAFSIPDQRPTEFFNGSDEPKKEKYIPPVLKIIRPSTDTLDDYNNDFGYLGQLLFNAVLRERQTVATQQSQLRPTIQIAQGKQHIIVQPQSSSQTGTSMSRIPLGGSSAVPRTPTTPSISGQQKFVLVSSQPRPTVPGAPSLTSLTGMASAANSNPTIVKLVTTASTAVTTTTSGAPAQKIVVMSVPSTSQGSTQSSTEDSIGTTSVQDVGMKSIFNG